ncbi:hypothetical protein E8E14_000814 [Neopestalotiopsis sp. 37M]|nr:hypothetical protein E8E14_000814 [Neopestalotiopsis sp. 37M]
MPTQLSSQHCDAISASQPSWTSSDRLSADDDLPKGADDTPAHVVCFGMLALAITPIQSISLKNTVTVQLGEGGQLWADEVVATLSTRDTALLELLRGENLELEISIVATALPLGTQSSKATSSAYVVLYGLEDLWLDLKKVLNSTGFFLQDPVGASRDVVYFNPQRLFVPEDARTSNVLVQEGLDVEEEEISMIDVLAQFTTQVDLEPTEGSNYLLTPLKQHQKQALTFMRNREAGWNLLGDRTDIWSLKKEPNGDIGYINNIDSSVHHRQPSLFRGGILADDMGSGKSLSMIALLAHDMDRRAIRRCNLTPGENETHGYNTTLIIMPPSLMQNWHNELIKVQDLEMLDVVMVTYTTLAAEWRTNRQKSIIFTSRWKRIILDEDPSAVTTQAACDIKSACRWAVTGTPIQNNLTDLQSLLTFLGVYPYDTKDIFHENFTSLWVSGQEVIATNRLKQLLGYIMLRRPSSHIELPPRKDVKMNLSFNKQEFEMYRAAKEKALDSINDALSNSGGYKNAIQKIMHLRLICNHGLWQSNGGCADVKLGEGKSDTEQWSSMAAHKTLSQFPSLGLSMTCFECNSLVDTNVTDLEAPILEPMPSIQVHLTRCLRLWCTACYIPRKTLSTSASFCLCDAACPIVPMRLDTVSRLTSPTVVNEIDRFAQRTFPTKIRALLDDVQKLPSYTKSIVFSNWRSTLDIARTALDEAGVDCVQIDGNIKPKERASIFERFQTDSTTRVLLLSLSCGAVGLTLTAASRVYLMEPQWNPSLEEQALARIYRIGQKQDVTTIRFLMKNSIEKYVTDIQDKKKDLISILLSSRSRVSQKRMRELRDWLK